MRTAPAVCFTVVRFRLWNLALLALGCVAAAILVRWVHRVIDTSWAWPAAIAAGLLAAGLAVSACRRAPHMLRWDGQVWHSGPAGADRDQLRPVRVEVCIDLQRWLLLRLWPTVCDGRSRVTAWLPIERQGPGADWHALRCAVYSASTLADVAASENRLTA